jgi:hypothetical protein
MKELRPLASLKAKAAKRKPGYLEACLSLGQLDQKTGLVQFTPEAWVKIRQQFKLERPQPRIKPPRTSKMPTLKKFGLGDAIHKVAGPIGRVINWPCMKSDGSTDLKPGSPCARVRDTLNRITT